MGSANHASVYTSYGSQCAVTFGSKVSLRLICVIHGAQEAHLRWTLAHKLTCSGLWNMTDYGPLPLLQNVLACSKYIFFLLFLQNDTDPLCCWFPVARLVRKHFPLDVSNKIVMFKLFMNVHLDHTTWLYNSLVSSRKRLDERPADGWWRGVLH